MSDHDTNRLLEAIDKLTLPRVTEVEQVSESGISCVSQSTQEPLIVQLRNARVSDVSGGAGGAQARERVPLDFDAVTRYENLDGQVRAFYLEHVGVRPPKDVEPEHLLRTAHAAYDENSLRVTGQWEGWVTQIEDKLAGVTRLELLAPCPVCEFEWYVNENGDQEVALQVTYRPDERKSLEASYAVCRFCAHTDTPSIWKGTQRLRELAYAIEASGRDTPMLNALVFTSETASAGIE